MKRLLSLILLSTFSAFTLGCPPEGAKKDDHGHDHKPGDGHDHAKDGAKK